MRRPSALAALLALFAASACDGLAVPTAGVEYRPEQAGTVDHAMCLLGFSAVPVRQLVTGHQLVDGELNGRPASFVLDTGANVSVVHGSHAEEFGLTPQRGITGAAVGLGGALQATRAGVEGLRIGEVDLRQRHVMVADLSQLESSLGRLTRSPIHGIVGQDVLRAHRAVIDVSRPMLYLRQENSAPAPVPAERCQGEGAGG
ncbi:MAG: retropepsin-like aspartic protease [Phenylobacterium sp.]|jgi:hypothetical protein|uniref:retropepsin-like aspartic protease n=1 Tax=Phenylobacterium sp. TaxID=1871053 RepID=UPI003919F1EC